MIEEDRLKACLAVWLREGLITSKEVGKILDFEGYREAPLPPPPMGTHKTLGELFTAIRAFVLEHPGAKVICANCPPLLGWSAYLVHEDEEQSQQFSITIVDAKRSWDTVPPKVQECFRSPGGRRRLAESLASGSYFGGMTEW